ncbi:uncharacterized protein LOC144792835 [Lissotriton helveticus]
MVECSAVEYRPGLLTFVESSCPESCEKEQTESGVFSQEKPRCSQRVVFLTQQSSERPCRWIQRLQMGPFSSAVTGRNSATLAGSAASGGPPGSSLGGGTGW